MEPCPPGFTDSLLASKAAPSTCPAGALGAERMVWGPRRKTGPRCRPGLGREQTAGRLALSWPLLWAGWASAPAPTLSEGLEETGAGAGGTRPRTGRTTGGPSPLSSKPDTVHGEGESCFEWDRPGPAGRALPRDRGCDVGAGAWMALDLRAARARDEGAGPPARRPRLGAGREPGLAALSLWLCCPCLEILTF